MGDILEGGYWARRGRWECCFCLETWPTQDQNPTLQQRMASAKLQDFTEYLAKSKQNPGVA